MGTDRTCYVRVFKVNIQCMPCCSSTTSVWTGNRCVVRELLVLVLLLAPARGDRTAVEVGGSAMATGTAAR